MRWFTGMPRLLSRSFSGLRVPRGLSRVPAPASAADSSAATGWATCLAEPTKKAAAASEQGGVTACAPGSPEGRSRTRPRGRRPGTVAPCPAPRPPPPSRAEACQVRAPGTQAGLGRRPRQETLQGHRSGLRVAEGPVNSVRGPGQAPKGGDTRAAPCRMRRRSPDGGQTAVPRPGAASIPARGWRQP